MNKGAYWNYDLLYKCHLNNMEVSLATCTYMFGRSQSCKDSLNLYKADRLIYQTYFGSSLQD